jgi:uncharacterized membrane protein YkgB
MIAMAEPWTPETKRCVRNRFYVSSIIGAIILVLNLAVLIPRLRGNILGLLIGCCVEASVVGILVVWIVAGTREPNLPK